MPVPICDPFGLGREVADLADRVEAVGLGDPHDVEPDALQVADLRDGRLEIAAGVVDRRQLSFIAATERSSGRAAVVQVAGAEPLQVERDVAVPGAVARRSTTSPAARRSPRQARRGRPRCARSRRSGGRGRLAEAEATQRRLDAVDRLSSAATVTGVPYGTRTGQARRGRLVPRAQAERRATGRGRRTS